MEVIKDKLSIENVTDFDHCHCMGKGKNNRPCKIILKVNKTNKKILRNVKKFKNTGIHNYEDFSDDTVS